MKLGNSIRFLIPVMIALAVFVVMPGVSVNAENGTSDDTVVDTTDAVGTEFVESTQELQTKIEQLQGVPDRGDFALGPTRFTYSLDPGEEIIVEIEITSRIGEETEFEVGVEDFTAWEDPEKYTKFLGEEKSQFSSREWFQPAVREFTLKHGERIYLPVKITVPQDAEVGDHYSAVFIKTVPEVSSGVILSSRVGSLFLITVGDDKVKKKGKIVSFKSAKGFYSSLPAVFEINFNNTGNVHLEPFGNVIISNIFGETIDEIKVPQWILLRESERIQKVDWSPDSAFGKYTATVQIERGYDNQTDVKTVTFWVLPVKSLAYIFGGLIVAVISVKFFTGRFEIRKKVKNGNKQQ